MRQGLYGWRRFAWWFAFFSVVALCIIQRILFGRAAGVKWQLVFWVMLLNVVVPFFLISWAEQSISSGMAAMLMGFGPFMALVGSHFTTTDDKLSRQKAIGALMGFTGIIILVGWDVLRGLGDNLSGQGAALLGSACYVTSGLIVRRLTGFPALQLSALVLGLSSITLLILALIFEGPPLEPFSQKAWLGLLYLGVFPNRIGLYLALLFGAGDWYVRVFNGLKFSARVRCFTRCLFLRRATFFKYFGLVGVNCDGFIYYSPCLRPCVFSCSIPPYHANYASDGIK